MIIPYFLIQKQEKWNKHYNKPYLFCPLSSLLVPTNTSATLASYEQHWSLANVTEYSDNQGNLAGSPPNFTPDTCSFLQNNHAKCLTYFILQLIYWFCFSCKQRWLLLQYTYQNCSNPVTFTHLNLLSYVTL